MASLPPAKPGPSHVGPPLNHKAITQRHDFITLVRLKTLFIIPATLFFILHYFALPILVGYFPSFMETTVIGKINLAYLFALIQFFMAWAVMGLYVWRAKVFDDFVDDIKKDVLAEASKTAPSASPSSAPAQPSKEAR